LALRVEAVRVGVDIGGTFTDLVAKSGTRESWRVKVPTSSPNPAGGALDAVRILLREYGVEPSRVQVVIHATTLASNALLTGNLPRTGLVTTEGFRDVLEIGRQNRPELYNLQVERLPPLIPREYRFEVEERVSYEGRVLKKLDLAGARKVARKTRQLGMESVAICFLHSYANPQHEKTVAKIIHQEDPDLLLSVSSELLPEFREYERTSTTVVNACLQPLMSRYLAEFQQGLAELGINAPLFVMQSNSGTLLSTQAAREPARIIESGPVAGAVASKAYAKQARLHDIISLDVGGTTSKAGVWSGDRFDLTDEYEVGGRIHGVRRLTGSGYPVRFPYVDLVEVGTGGGSTASVDGAGVLHVGPESAGSTPGPACYDRGGEKPTLTDANLILGRLNPEHLIGGGLRLDRRRAEKAVQKFVAKPMGTNVSDAAVGILRVAISNIANAVRAASVEKGRDPRKMTLVAFGGAGPMHACETAQEMEIRNVLIPPWAGVFSSLGLLLAAPLHSFAKTVLSRVDKADPARLEDEFSRMEKQGRKLLRQEGVSNRDQKFERSLDMRYEGQSYELQVPITSKTINRETLDKASREFHSIHHRTYGYRDPENPVELVNLRVDCKGTTPQSFLSQRGTLEAAPAKNRPVFVGGRWERECPVFERQRMQVGSTGKGPCIVEDYDSTLVLPRAARYSIDRTGSFRIALTN
jgi:N-methylhydantoinase A